MNSQSIILLTFSVALLAVGAVYVKKSRFRSIIPYIAILLGTVGVMISFYLNANLDYEDAGTPAQYGQLGDYFGGLLNPVFGFITILILLHTWRIEINKSIGDSAQRYRGELYEYLQKSIDSFDADLVKKGFYEEPSYLERYTKNGKLMPKFVEEIERLMKTAKEIVDKDNPIPKDQPEALIKSYARLRIKMRTIVWGYIELITVHEISLIRLGLVYDLLNWAEYLIRIGLATQEELDQILTMANNAHKSASAKSNNKPSKSPPQYQ